MNHRLIAGFLGLLLVVASGGVCFEWFDPPRSLGVSPAEAAPPSIPPETVVVATGGNVEVEILPMVPGILFTNNIFFLSTSSDDYIGSNRDAGTVVKLGTFPQGAELVFAIGTPDSHTYVTGPGDRNPDGIVHAIIEANGAGAVTIRFEDLFAGGDFSFSDAVIRVTGATLR